MENLDRFELQGMTYYQEGRRCGKPGCKCATGEPHGPYWYARDGRGGAVRYVGKDLPGEVVRARAAHERLKQMMYHERNRAQRELDALNRLIYHDELGNGDAAILAALGLGDALVHLVTR